MGRRIWEHSRACDPILKALEYFLEVPWKLLKALYKRLGPYGPCWRRLDASVGRLGQSWRRLGLDRERCGNVRKLLWGVWGGVGGVLGRLGRFWKCLLMYYADYVLQLAVDSFPIANLD